MCVIENIAVIDPAIRLPELECFNHLISLSKIPLSYHLPALFGLDSLKAVENTKLCGVVVLGSISSVNDKLPWQKELADWLRPVMEKCIPTLGLCFGHQFIAHIFGARVSFRSPNHDKCLGFRKIRLSTNPLWKNKPLEGEIFVSHREIVENCPIGFEIIGTSDVVHNDAMAHATLPVWSFQSHPEATPQFLQHMNYLEPTPLERLSFGYSILRKFFDYTDGHRTHIL